jgi:hypothetical protein
LLAVLEASLVGREGGGTFERGALRTVDRFEAETSAIEVDEAQLHEDPHQAARECRGPWLRPLAPEQRLTGLTARHPHRAQGAVHGGQRLAQVEVPFVYPYSKV